MACADSRQPTRETWQGTAGRHSEVSLAKLMEGTVTSAMNCYRLSEACHLWKLSNQDQMDVFLEDASSLYSSY